MQVTASPSVMALKTASATVLEGELEAAHTYEVSLFFYELGGWVHVTVLSGLRGQRCSLYVEERSENNMIDCTTKQVLSKVTLVCGKTRRELDRVIHTK